MRTSRSHSISLIFLGTILPSLFAEVIIGENGALLDHSLAAQETNDGQGLESFATSVGDDLILFHNGDLMHGTFGGMDRGLLWQRADIEQPIRFSLPHVKQIIFNSSRRLPLDQNTSFITLTSGDRIPGEIISLDEKTLTLKSSIMGELALSRNLIRSISPNPFGGNLHYLGPYHSDGWLTLAPLETENKKEEEKEDTPQHSSWVHSGTSFYSQDTAPLILADAQLPDIGRISFNIAWKGRLSIALALHSDLTRISPTKEDHQDAHQEENDEEPIPATLIRESVLDYRKGNSFQSIPWVDSQKKNYSELFGTGYTLSIQSGYPTLTRNYFSETGAPRQSRLNTTRSSTSLGESGEAQIEIRFNREKSLIFLYINGIYSNQWNDLSGYLGQGRALGFVNRSASSKVRISELAISSWGGVTDSIRSLEHPERDIVQLTNGADRFSGKLSHIHEGLAHFKTRYSKIRIPVSDLSLINFSEADLLDPEGEENEIPFHLLDDLVTIAYQPHGLIKVIPLSANPTTLTAHSPFLGKVNIDISSALLLQFSDSSPDLSSWFDDFKK